MAASEARARGRFLGGRTLLSVLMVLVFSGGTLLAAKPNVLLIVTDDQRPDTIGALGNPYIDTPHLDRLARRGTSFTRAIVANPHCVPSRAEIMTGATGFRNTSPPFGRAMNPELKLWAQAMREAGYHTGYSGKWMNDGQPKTRGYDRTDGLFSSGGASRDAQTLSTAHNGRPVTGYRGWTFKTNEGQVELDKGVGLTPHTDRHIADGAVAFLQRERAANRPFFLHVNFTGPHDPLHLPPGYEKKYDPATMPLPANFLSEHPFDHGNAGSRDELLIPLPRRPEDVKAEIAAYYAVVSNLDEQVGRIMDALRAIGQEENTIILFTSDHGLALGSHGLMGKQNMYEHTIGVPLLMAGPGVPEDQRLATQTYLRDLYPTVCEMLGVPIPSTVEGRSLVPALSGLAREIYPEVYAYWHRPGLEAGLPVQRMVRTERWKLIYYSNLDRFQLFDLAHDPYELKDLATSASHQEIRATLQQKLTAWFTPRIESWAASPRSP